MNRRTFIRVSTSGGIGLLGLASFSSCKDEAGVAFDPWSGPSHLLDEEDVRLRIVAYGLLSPSFKNAQPWWVDLKGDGIIVRPEVHRIPQVLDPSGRQTMVTLGAFIETMAVAASSFGYRLDVRTFPDGIDPAGLTEQSVVARCLLVRQESVSADPLFDGIRKRRTTRTPFDGRPLTSEHAEGFRNVRLPDPVECSIITDGTLVKRIAQIVRDSAMEEFGSEELRDAMLGHLRFTEEQVRTTRDGMTVMNTGLSGPARWWFGLLSTLPGMDHRSFIDRLPGLIEEQTRSASAFGLLLTDNDSPPAQLAAGRGLMRTYLQAAHSGVSLQPFSRVLESQNGMQNLASLGSFDGRTIQALFRLGYASDVPPSPRRSLFEIVRI